MRSGKLNARLIEVAHQRGELVELLDGSCLYFRKQSREGASWFLRYSFGGRTRHLTLGNYPDMSLAVAREEARAQRVLIDRGVDPAVERQRLKDGQRQQIRFREVAEAWYDSEIVGRVKHPGTPRRYLDLYLLPKLGQKAARDVTAADLVLIVNAEKRRAPSVANDILRFARRIGSYGVRHQILEVNRFSSLSPRLDGGGPEKPKTRALSRSELATLFRAIRATPTFGGDNLLAIKLLLALCVRKMELLAARWDEFDLDGSTELGAVWRLPAARSKTGEALDVPLVPAVVDWLEALRELSAGNDYVFPQRRRHHRRRAPHVGPDTLNVALTRVTHGLEPFTIHDLRRTARTQLGALGVRPEVAERCLCHKLPGIQRVYDVYDYFPERRKALELWTEILLQAEHDEHKIVPHRERINSKLPVQSE